MSGIRQPDKPSGLKPHAIGRLHRQALVIAGGSRWEPSPNELKLARHMARDGASLIEIHAALGHPMRDQSGFNAKMRRYNIRSRVHGTPKGPIKPSHLGGETGLALKGKSINILTWRPRSLA